MSRLYTDILEYTLSLFPAPTLGLALVLALARAFALVFAPVLSLLLPSAVHTKANFDLDTEYLQCSGYYLHST
jgi:hypothetical protein